MSTVKVGQRYKHFKGFELEVLMIAKNTENLENMVIYEHSNQIWARPESMFLDKEDVSNREDNVTGQKHRFELI